MAKSTTAIVSQSATTTKVEVVKKAKSVTKVTYLKEGVTGKDLMNNIYKSNNAVKEKRRSFSQCLKEVLEQIKVDDTFKDVPSFMVSECTPKNLIPLRREDRTIKGAGWSPYEVLSLIKKFYQVGNGKKQK
jgi:hypothetical protein